MASITLSQFRAQQSEYIAAAQREPVEIMSRGVGRRAVVVSLNFLTGLWKRLKIKLTFDQQQRPVASPDLGYRTLMSWPSSACKH